MPTQARTSGFMLMVIFAALALSGCPGPQPRPTVERPAVDRAAMEPEAARLERMQRAEDLALRARVHIATGRHHLAVRDLTERERLLDDPADVAENQQRIWAALRQVDADLIESDDPMLRGWLELAELQRIAWQEPRRFERAAAEWRERHPSHPAERRFLPQLVADQGRVAAGVRAIGVILPLSGRFAAAAAAVRDGLLAAHYRYEDVETRPSLRFYDTAGDPETAVQRYREAVGDGVDVVIGPLQKDAVAALSRLGTLPVPLLALNTLDEGVAPAALFQFGLVPEDEAVQVAERIVIDGHAAGIALVPDTELGIRMLQAFRARLEELGGTLLAAELYAPQQQDHSAAIVRALAIDQSRSRHQVLRTVLNMNLQWEPRRRRDTEFVFVVGNPQQGRALRPQLRFHHASDLPVYASSHVYTGIPDRARDADMNGIVFTDMPWTIAPDSSTAASRRALTDHFGPSMERNTRLFALGYDAYRLAPVILHNPDLLRDPVPAATGALRLGANGRIGRILYWAQFTNGVAHPLQ